jgi:hypothetical protein
VRDRFRAVDRNGSDVTPREAFSKAQRKAR